MITGTSISQGTRAMARDHGGNDDAQRGTGTGRALGDCPECGTTFYQSKPSAQMLIHDFDCSGCGLNYIDLAILRGTNLRSV